jgi:ABC-type branched-subunit amino acid transport system permease subunit
MNPTTAAVIAIAVAATSEALSLYPAIRANGIIQALLMVAKAVFPKRR